ncbi:NAD(P)H-binding protein [Flavobacterium sp. I3-2]|uniref:NAD(P)H-binding protein n=1 Tax=Flavobacterium sp. I3-2 TaxID=2748319 RepID=UPI0015AE597A|nr:semialdehyde dehydrogenase [Flavobacterium sp. I3-2]
MKAIVIGGSGATGKALINQLILDDSYSEIISFVRKHSTIKNRKLKEIIIDFEKLSDYKTDIIGNVAFSCLGTTLKVAGSKEAQWRIDYEYQLEFAKICKANNIKTFVLVSSVGANSGSKIFYSKMKGCLENDIKNLNFKQLFIFQPPGLIRPFSDRKGEILGIKVIQFFNAIGLFKNYKPLHVDDLAKNMIQSTKQLPDGTYTLKSLEIKKILSTS